MIRIDGNIPHTSPESFQIHIPCLPHRFTHQTVELWHRALVSWVTNVPDLHTTLPSCVNVSGGVTDGNGAHHLSVVQCVDLTGMAGNPWAHQSVRGERHWLHLSVSRHVKRVSTDDTKEDRRRRLNMIANVTEDEDKDKYWYKSLSIIFRGGFFFFFPHVKTVLPQGKSISFQIYKRQQTLTVCHQGFLSDWEAFQELSCEDEDQNRPERDNKDIISAYSRQTSAKSAQVNSNLWNRTQTLMSTRQTDTLEHTHPPHLNVKFKSRQTDRDRAVGSCAPSNPTHTAGEYTTRVSIKYHTHTHIHSCESTKPI